MSSADLCYKTRSANSHGQISGLSACTHYIIVQIDYKEPLVAEEFVSGRKVPVVEGRVVSEYIVYIISSVIVSSSFEGYPTRCTRKFVGF